MGILNKMSRWQNTSKKDQIVYDPNHEKITVAPGGILTPANKGEEDYYNRIMKSNIFFAPAGPGQSAPGVGVSNTKLGSGLVNGGGVAKTGQPEKTSETKGLSLPESSDAILDQPKDGLKTLETKPKEQILIQAKLPQVGANAKIEIETGRRRGRPKIEREPESEPVQIVTPPPTEGDETVTEPETTPEKSDE